MFSNYTSFIQENEEPYFIGEESWETFMQSDFQNPFNCAPPAPGISDITFERYQETSSKMEEDHTAYDHHSYTRASKDDSHLYERKNDESFKLSNQCHEIQDSDCRRGNQETDEEEAGSVTTGGSVLNEKAFFDCDKVSVVTNEDFFDNTFDYDMKIMKMIEKVLNDRSDEEKAYIEKVFYHILDSINELLSKSQLTLNYEMIKTIVDQLLRVKVRMITEERELTRDLIEQEMQCVRQGRPEKMVSEDVLAVSNRKEKRALKGNRNSSSMNHFNENYVSNIFQFARRNYPEDREIQRIANERNVSASNFKRLVGAKLADGVLTRKAKARITESGKELVKNIRYWMGDGYFDQCNDREKYVLHKQKALRDLALSGKY